MADISVPRKNLARLVTWIFLTILLAFTILALLRIRQSRTGDFKYIFEAATAVTLKENIYHFGSGIYPYPPLTAAWVSWLVPLGERGAAIVWLPMNVAMLGLAVWLGAQEMLKRLNIRGDCAALPMVALFTLLLVSEPALGTIRRCNKDVFLLLPIVLALRWIDRRPLLAGALLALGASVKFLTFIFLPYFLLRGRFRAVLGFASGWLFCFFAPGLIMGWNYNVEMQKMAYGGVARMLGIPVNEAGIANAAPPGLEVTGSSALQAIRRLGVSLHWSKSFTYAVVGIFAILCAAIIGRLFARAGQPLWAGRFGHVEESHAKLVLLDWVIVTTAMLVFSLHLETRHTVMLAPVYATAAAMLLRQGSTPRLPLAIATAASFLAYRLPPGAQFPEAMQQWRFVGGSSWVLVTFLMVLLWTALRYEPKFNSLRESKLS